MTNLRNYLDIINENNDAAAQAMIDAYNALRNSPDADPNKLNNIAKQYRQAFGGDITTSTPNDYEAGKAEGLDMLYQRPNGEKTFERHLERYNRLQRLQQANPENFANSIDDNLKKFMQEFTKTNMYRQRAMF